MSGDVLFIAGSPAFDRDKILMYFGKQILDYYDARPPFKDAMAALAGKKGGVLYAVKKSDGSEVMSMTLPSIPVFDGLIAADRRLFVSMQNGKIVCLEKQSI